MARTAYQTIAREATAAIEAKRSRFVCRLARVSDELAAREVVAAARREHWSARHHCSALRIGPEGDLRRSSDDGEPSGTAGAPMLQVLERRDVSDVVAVVSRYFGGTLLGAGGLARAYADAVEAALDEAGYRARRLLGTAQVTVPMSEAGRVESLLRDRGVVRDVRYADFARIRIVAEDLGPLAQLLAAQTGGLATVAPLGAEWVDR